MNRLRSFGIILIVLFTCGSAGNNPRTLKAVRTSAPPVIDGYGNDDVWKKANIATNFLQRDPDEGSPATEQTEVKLLYDDKNLYLFAMMCDSSPEKIIGRLSRRDDENESDFFAIGIDSYNDKQTAYMFYIYASGSVRDAIKYNDGRNEDFSWDPIWELKTRILPNGWSVEVKLPLSQIRFTEGNDTWGINFGRKISRTQEETHWALMRKGVDGLASLFGTVTGMADIKLPLLFEVLPYVVGSSEHYPQTSQRIQKEKFRPNAGVDIKYGVSSNFTLDATVNPDFAQIEADPAVLNLSTIETFYPEKRPFFIEGTQILRFVTFGGDFGPGLFYSRRIGKAIEIDLPDDGAYITEEPSSATILGAAKFSGKTSSGTSIGILTAATNEEQFTYRDTLGNLKTVTAEPTASYNLFRIKQDFRGNSNIGGIVTATARNGKHPAFTGGADWDVRFNGNDYRLNGFFAHSRFLLPNGAVQEGSAGNTTFGRTSGNWIYSVNADFTSKAYNINDIGYFGSPNDYGVSGSTSLRNYIPGKIFRRWSVGISPHFRWNFDGLTISRQIQVNASGEFLNYWDFECSTQYSLSAKDPYEPRGLGAYNSPANFSLRGELQTDYRATIIIGIEESYQKNTIGAEKNKLTGGLVLHPSTSIDFKLSLGYATERGVASFAGVIIDSTLFFAPNIPAAAYGKRDVDQTDVTLRSSILFTNTLSLQLYNQFFWASGRYKNFSALQPDGDLFPYAFTGNPNFNRTSFISNVVLRWEYTEGSVFYLVWSHGRRFFQSGNSAENTFTTAVDHTFAVAPDNTYVVKINYWMSL
ncbi:MAG: carbohydrate binding family 9 domain-containing protein [Bacteroidetes bacterium]|nr:carbohydrate binding family 9 domain-containing protein [Bacteroidota bacterium]